MVFFLIELLFFWVFWYYQVGKDVFFIFWLEKNDFRPERYRSVERQKIDLFLEGWSMVFAQKSIFFSVVFSK